MENTSFNYSLKNIPFPDKSSYTLKLMEKIESVIKRMRWKAYFYLNKETQKKISRRTPQDSNPGTTRHSVAYLKNLRKDVFDIKSIKFRKVRNKFQEELKEDLSKIRKSRNMFNFEDKTNNVYEMKSD